jgi:pimeloyl-ACP methyl ester carboxylesterase
MYADINGLKMFYEIRGTSDPVKVPLVLLHGAISATGTSFGPLPDLLAQSRQVIAVEQQGHGRTADIDRPLSVHAMADDTLALLASLGIGRADLFGYSLGAGIALNIITRHPAVVRKAVLASVTYDKTGLHPEMRGGPESGESADAPGRDLQIPFEQEYRALAPDPGNWPALLAKVQAMDLPEITPQAIAAINVPILLIIGRGAAMCTSRARCALSGLCPGHGFCSSMYCAAAVASLNRLLALPCAANPQASERRWIRSCGVPANVPPSMPLTLAALAKHRAALL